MNAKANDVADEYFTFEREFEYPMGTKFTPLSNDIESYINPNRNKTHRIYSV